MTNCKWGVLQGKVVAQRTMSKRDQSTRWLGDQTRGRLLIPLWITITRVMRMSLSEEQWKAVDGLKHCPPLWKEKIPWGLNNDAMGQAKDGSIYISKAETQPCTQTAGKTCVGKRTGWQIGLGWRWVVGVNGARVTLSWLIRKKWSLTKVEVQEGKDLLYAVRSC